MQSVVMDGRLITYYFKNQQVTFNKISKFCLHDISLIIYSLYDLYDSLLELCAKRLEKQVGGYLPEFSEKLCLKNKNVYSIL